MTRELIIFGLGALFGWRLSVAAAMFALLGKTGCPTGGKLVCTLLAFIGLRVYK